MELLSTSRGSEYFLKDSLRTLTGLVETRWDEAFLKELSDNALDSIDEAESKVLRVHYGAKHLGVFDSGPGMSEDLLDKVHDFGVYVSSKRLFRVPSRGAQGNALKTLTGIAFHKGYRIYYFSNGKRYYYKLDAALLRAGEVRFKKTIRDTKVKNNGVIVVGPKLHEGEIQSTLRGFHLANLDTQIETNNAIFQPKTKVIARSNKTFIHWYDRTDFEDLLNIIAGKDPDRSIRKFCNIFSGTQRIMKDLPIQTKTLKNISGNSESIKVLYDFLMEKIKPPNPKILKTSAGKSAFVAALGGDDEEQNFRYKQVSGTYQHGSATIPYMIEGAIVQGLSGPSRAFNLVNSSKPYRSDPFLVNSADVTFHNKSGHISNTSALLTLMDFSESDGVLLVLHLVSPYLQFTDKGKTAISVDTIFDDIVKVMSYLTKTVAKEIRRAQKEKRRYNRELSMMSSAKKEFKIDLMYKWFLPAFHETSGGYPVKCRQVWYKVRELVNQNEGVELLQTDFGRFRSDVALYYQEEDPEVKQLLLSERRGSFIDPFFRRELPLATKEVREYVDRKYNNKIKESRNTKYDISPEYLFDKVLFIEKLGFNDLILRSELDRELNMGVMSSQGFGTRAAKSLMKYFLELGLEVYILVDCDIAGYLIYHRIKHGSHTYRMPLTNVKRIGLTYTDVVSLGKEDLFEVHTRKVPYTRKLLESVLTEEEIDFFCVSHNEYRRVELNALTNNEFLDFIRDKVSNKLISVPPDKIIRQNIKIDSEEILGRALSKLLPDLSLRLDKGKVLSQIKRKVNEGNEHWVHVMRECIEIEKESQSEGLCKIIKKCLSPNASIQISKIVDFTREGNQCEG